MRTARFWIANYSIPKAKQRLERARVEKIVPQSTKTAVQQELFKKLRSLEISGSQVGDTRPISSAYFSPDESLIATSSW